MGFFATGTLSGFQPIEANNEIVEALKDLRLAILSRVPITRTGGVGLVTVSATLPGRSGAVIDGGVWNASTLWGVWMTIDGVSVDGALLPYWSTGATPASLTIPLAPLDATLGDMKISLSAPFPFAAYFGFTTL